MTQVISISHVNKFIDFDSSNIERRLQKKLNLQQEQIKELCDEYKKFLYLAKMNPETSLVPGKLVDEVWHDHILHTKQYQADCKRILGRYMHHIPSTNEAGENINPTFELYESTFGTKPPGEYWSCGRWCNTCCGNGGDCSNCKNI